MNITFNLPCFLSNCYVPYPDSGQAFWMILIVFFMAEKQFDIVASPFSSQCL